MRKNKHRAKRSRIDRSPPNNRGNSRKKRKGKGLNKKRPTKVGLTRKKPKNHFTKKFFNFLVKIGRVILRSFM